MLLWYRSTAVIIYGSDTVLLIKAKPSKRFLNLEVLEILARPRGRG
jgi:hypothetical protein